MATTDVEVVSVAPVQHEGDTSSAVGRNGTLEQQVARQESWTPRPCVARVDTGALRGAQPKSCMSHGVRPKLVRRRQRRNTGSGGLTTWACGQTVSLCMVGGLTAGARGLTASLYSRGGQTAWACCLTTSLYFGCGQTTRTCSLTTSGGKPSGIKGAGSGAGMGAAPGKSSCRKMSKSLVRRGEAEKGKSASSKTTCQETMMLLVVTSSHL
jgi:hypothetical protein